MFAGQVRMKEVSVIDDRCKAELKHPFQRGWSCFEASLNCFIKPVIRNKVRWKNSKRLTIHRKAAYGTANIRITPGLEMNVAVEDITKGPPTPKLSCCSRRTIS